MYAIIVDGEIISLCDHPRYIKKNPSSGAYIQCQEKDAEGVAANGTPYNINGEDAIPDAPQAFIRNDEGNEYIFNIHAKAERNESDIIVVEDALMESDASSDERMNAIEDAIFELDEKINGGI